MTHRRDNRSPEAEKYRHLYRLAAWKRARAAQLERNPLCEKCQKQGHITPATVVNHRRPHRGDMALFLDPANLESTCKPHHDGAIQAFERTGHERGCDIDGNPIDPRSHWNTGGEGETEKSIAQRTGQTPPREENPKFRAAR